MRASFLSKSAAKGFTQASTARNASSARFTHTVTARNFSSFKDFISKDKITISDPHWNRSKAIVGPVMVQLSIGGVYAWSIYNEPLTRLVGTVASVADDWSLGAVMPIFSMCAVSLGVVTATCGSWTSRVGPRTACLLASVFWSGGLAVTALGVHIHSLPVVYAGYSLLGGAGWGLGYLSPIPALMEFYPKARGFASGIGLSAFGAGAMMAAPLESKLLEKFFRAPEYLGKEEELSLVTENGKRFLLEDGGGMREVVVAGASDLARLPISGLQEGAYLLGTGDTGASMTFLTLSAGYLLLMTTGSLLIRLPSQKYLTENNYIVQDGGHTESSYVSLEKTWKTPQFYLLWTALFGNCVAGVSMIASAKTLLYDIFSTSYPLVVTSAFCASFVVGLAASNTVGRLVWGSLSDRLGRKLTYGIFGLSIPLVMSIPHIVGMLPSDSLLPLVLFGASTATIVSFYGACFSVLPAYVTELFGQKNMQAIFGRILTALPVAALVGPLILNYLRNQSMLSAIEELAQKVDAEAFLKHFGRPISELSSLTEAKIITVPRLLEILPEGTPDPSLYMYNSTFYAMGGFLMIAFLSNLLIKPVSKKMLQKA
jgi:MFS family permease